MTTQLRSRNTVELEVEKQLMLAERDELEAAKLELQADRAEFRAEKLEWQVTKGGSSAKASSCDCQATKAGLEAERLQLETEKTQLRVAQSQLKAAQSQLEAAKSQLETAQTQLEKARDQLEIATKHLEAAKAQTDIDNTRLEAAKASLEAAKMRFGAATKQLNAAKSRLEAAKTRLDLASSSIEAEKSHLQDEKAVLEIKVSEVESEKAKLEVKVSQLENDKFELDSEPQGSKSENKSLIGKMKEVVKKLEQCCKDKKALQEEAKPSVEVIKKVIPKQVFLALAINDKAALEIKVSEVESEKAKLEVKVSQLENDKFELGSELQGSKAEVERLLEKMKEVVMQLDQCNESKKTMQKKSVCSKVFLDLSVNGKPAGRLVIELDFDKAPRTAEYFRTLCTGEKGVNQSNGTPLHYKGSKLRHQGYHSVEWYHVQPDGRINDDIYGPICPKENEAQKHSGPGNVCIHPRSAGGSYFFITGDETEEWHSNCMYIVFGQVVEGMSVMAEMSKAGNRTCVIADCGQISE